MKKRYVKMNLLFEREKCYAKQTNDYYNLYDDEINDYD